MPKNRFLLFRVKKTYSQGFINILSLISLLFLTISLLIGAVVIFKNGLSFDIRKLAFVPREEGTSYSSKSTTTTTKVTTPTKKTTPVTQTTTSTRTLKKDCAAQCGNDQDECYKSCIGGQEFSTAANVPSVQSTPTTPEVPIEIWRAQQPTSTPSVYSNPENLGCSPCSCSGIATCPGGGQIKCTVPSSCSQKPLTIGDLYSAPKPVVTEVPIEIWRAQQPTSTPVSGSQIPLENIVTTGIAIVPTTNINNLGGAGVDISNPILNWIMNRIKPTDESVPWYIKLFSGSDQEVKNEELKLTTEEETEDLKSILKCSTYCTWGCNQSNGKCNLNPNAPWSSVVTTSDVKVDKPDLEIQDTKINPSYNLGDLKKGKTLCSGKYKPGEIVLWGGKVQGCSGLEGWIPLSDYGFTPEILTVKPDWLTPDSKTWQALDSLASNNNAGFDEKGNLIPSTVTKQPWCNTDSGGVPSGTVSQGGTDSGGDPKSNRSRCITNPKNPNSGIWENCSSDVNSLNYCALTIVPSWYNKEDLQKEQKLFKENNQKVFEAFNNEYSNCVNKGNLNCSEIATNSLSGQGYNPKIIEGSKSLVNAQNSLYSDYFPVYENYVNNCSNNPSSLDCINLKAHLNRTLAQTGVGQYFDIKTANENFASYLYNTTANKYVQLKIEYQNNCTKDRKLLSDSQYEKCFGSGGINEQIGKIDSSDEFKYFEARAKLNNCNGSTDCSYWTNQISSLEKSESIKVLLTETNAKTKYQSILSYWQNYLQNVSNQQKEYSDLVGAAVTDNYSKLQDECTKKYGAICSSDRLKQFGNDTLVNIFNDLDPDLKATITNQVNSYVPINKCTEGYVLGGGSYKACTCPEGYYRNYDLCLPKTGTTVASTLSPEEKNILLVSIIKNQLICDSQNGGLYQSATGLCIKEIAGQKPDIFVLGREVKSPSECVSSEEYNSVTQKCVIKQQAAIKLAVGLRGNCAEGYRDASAFSDTCVPELSKKTDTFLNRIYADNFAQNSTISNIGTIIVNPIASFFDDTLKSICTNSMISDQKSWINCKNFTTVGLLNLNNGDLELSKGVEYGITSDKPWGKNTDKVVNNWMAQSVYDLASSTDGLIPQNYHDQNFKVDLEKLKKDGFYEKVLEHTNKLIQTQARETSFGGFLKNIFNAGYVDSEEVLSVGYSWMDAYTKEVKGEKSNFRPVVNYNPLFVVDDSNQVLKASEKSTPTLGSFIVEGLLKQIFGKDSAHIMYKSLTGNSNPNNIERQRDLIVGDDSNSLKTSFERLGVSFDPSIDSYESWIKNNKDESKVDVEKQKIFSISSKQVNNYLNTAREKPGYIIAPLAQNGVSVVAGVLSNIFLPDKIVTSVAVQVGADVATQWVVDQTTYTVFERISDALVIAANEGEISSFWSDSATNALNDFKRQEYAMNLGTSLVFNAVGEFIGKGIADNLLAKSLIKNNEYAEAAAKGMIVNNVDEITQEMVEGSSKFIGVTNKGELITFLTKEQIQEATKFNQIVKIALIDVQVEQSSKEIAEAAINKLSRTLFTVSPKEATQEVAESLNKNVSKQASETFLELAEPRNYLAQGGKSPGIIWVENLINKNKPVTESIENLTIGNLKNTDVAGLANGEVLDIPKAAKQGAYLRLYDNLTNQIVYYGKASDYLGDIKLGSNILVQISDTPLIKETGSLSATTLKNFSEIVSIQKPNYIRTVNGVVLNSFDESFEGMSFGAKNKGLLVDIVTDGRVQKGIINSAGEIEKLDIFSSFVARISKNSASIIDPDTGGITLKNVFQKNSSSEGKILVELHAHLEDLQKGSIKASKIDEVFENIEGSGKVKYITSTGQVKISDFNSIDDLNRLKGSLNKQQAIWFETGDGEEKTVRMFVSDGAGTSSYHERILPKIDLDANSSYRLSTDGASGKLLDDINEFNRIISNFEENSPIVGFKLRQEQIEILTAPETIRQLQAGGGKSTVVGPILGAMEKNTVQVLGDVTNATKYAQVIGSNNAFYKSEGIETVYFDDTRNAFLKIVDNKFDSKTAEAINVDEMWKIVNRTTGKSGKGGLLIVTTDSDKAWAIIRGSLKDGDPVSELFYNISLKVSKGGKGYTYIVDEIGENVNARFSVAHGNPILIKNITDKSVLHGYENAGDFLKVSNQVLDETPALNEFRKQILANKNVNELFTVYKDANGIKTRILIPSDVTIVGKSYADIIDQALTNSSLPDDSIVRAELTNLSFKLRQVSDENFDAINKEFSDLLQKGAMDFDGDLKLNQSAFSDLSFRKKVLETDWRELSRVAKNNFDFEYVMDKDGNKLFGQIVLRKSGGTTGEEYSDIVDKIVLQREAPRILKANAFEVDESSLKSIGDLTFTPKSSQITNKEIYQDVVEKYIGYDATPDSAASALGIRSTAPSERPPLPTIFVRESNYNDVATNGLQRMKDAGVYEGYAKSYVNIDNSVPHINYTKQIIRNDENVSVVARTKYFTNEITGESSTEYYLQRVIRGQDGSIDFQNIRTIASEDEWQKAIAEQFNTDGFDPKTFNIFYEGRGRAADFAVIPQHRNIKWTVISNDSNNMEEVLQAIKRNRVFASQTDLLDVNNIDYVKNGSWIEADIERATSYNLWLTSDNEKLVLSETTGDSLNVIDYYEKVLQNDLAKSNVESRLVRIANSQVSSLESAKEFLTANLPSSRQSYIRNYLDLLITDTQRVSAQAISNLSRTPLTGREIAEEIYVRGNNSYISFQNTLARLSSEFNLNNGQISSLKNILGLNQDFIAKDTYFSIWESANKSITFENPKGPSQEVMFFAETTSPESMPSGIFYNKTEPDTQKVAQVIEDQVQDTPKKIITNNVIKAIKIVTSAKTMEYIKAGPKVWVAGISKVADDFTKSVSQIFKVKENQLPDQKQPFVKDNVQRVSALISQLINNFIKGLQKGINFVVDKSTKLATPEAKQKINNFINKIKKEKKIEITINLDFKTKNWWKSKNTSKFVLDTIKGFDSLTQKNEGFFYSYLNAKPTGSDFRSFIRFAISRYFLLNYPLSKTIIGWYDVLRLVRWIGAENKILPPITKVTQVSKVKVTSIKQTYPWKLLTESYKKVKDFVTNPKRFSQNTRDIVNKPIQLVSDLVNSTKKPDKVKNPKSVEDVKNIVQQIKNLILNPKTIIKDTINQVKKFVNSSPEIVKKLTPKGNKTDQGVKKSEQTVKQEIAKQEKGKTFQTVINVGSGTGTPHHISKLGAINNPLKVGEDYYGSDPNGIIAVADGVSHQRASSSPEGARSVVQRMIQVLKTIQNSKWDKNLTGLVDTIKKHTSNINSEMLSKYPSPQSATTFVGAVIVNDKLITIKAGDSRVYLLRNNTAYELNETKVGTEQLPIQNQPNTFGSEWFSGVSISIHNLTPGDRVIVASDGFEKYYRNDLFKQIKNILLEQTPAEAESRFRNLVLAAEKSLGMKKDDTSAVVMFYDKQETKTPGITSTTTKLQQPVVKNKSGKILLSVLLSGTLLSIAANSLFGFNPLYVPKSQFAIREPVPIVQEVDQNVLTKNYNLYESAETSLLPKDGANELLSEAELKSIEQQNVETNSLSKVKAIEFSSNNEKSYKVSGVSNPYQLIPDWYYEKILPKIVSSTNFCNDVNACRSELKYLPIASHVGTKISLSSNYEEGLNFSRLDGKYTVNPNNKVLVRSDIKVKLENFVNEVVLLDKSYYLKYIEAYRSYWNQDLAYRNSTTGDVAEPGFSQHPTGLAIDWDTNIPRDILIKVANKNGFVSPFNLNSGWSDPPHWYYLDGVFPGLTQMIINAGYDPNDINLINQVTLGISQTYEGKIKFLNTNNSGFEAIAQNYVTYSNDKQALLSLPEVKVGEDKKVISNPQLQLNSGNIGNVKSVKYGDSGILKLGLIIPGGVNIYSSKIKNDLFYNAITNSNIGCNSMETCKQNFQKISPVGGTTQEVGNPVRYSSDYSPTTAGLIDVNLTGLAAPEDALPDDEILLPKQVVDQIIEVNKILKDKNYDFQIRIVSGYRSFENQQKYRSQRANQTSAAVEGYSQHQSSYALDITLVNDQGKNLGFSANRDRKVVDILNSYGIVHPIPQDSQHIFALDANTGINGYTENLIKQGIDVNNYENTVKATLVAMQTYEYMLSTNKSIKNTSSTDNNTGPSSVYMNASIIPFLNAEMFEKLADKYIYSKWPEAKERGTLPVLYDAIKKFIEGKINKNKVTSDTGVNNQSQNIEASVILGSVASKVTDQINFTYYKLTGNSLFEDRDVFNASEEIKKLWLTKPNSEDRKKAIELFKQKYAYQQVGFSEMKIELENAIKETPSLEYSEIVKIYDKYSSQYKFPEKYKLTIFEFYKDYQKVRKNLISLRRKVKDKNELFKMFFGIYPKGEITVVYQPLNILFVVPNEEDYTNIYTGNTSQSAVSEEIKNRAISTGGFKNTKTIDQENYYFTVVKDVNDTKALEHEEQHVINDFLELYSDVAPTIVVKKTLLITPTILTGYLDQVEEYVLEKTKNELLSFLSGKKQSISINDIPNILNKPYSEGGHYDYYHDFLKGGWANNRLFRNLTKLQREDVNKYWDGLVSDPKLIKRKEETLKDALNALFYLMDNDFEKSQAVSLLENELLYKWSAVAKRIKPLFDIKFEERKAKVIDIIGQINWEKDDISILLSGEIFDYFQSYGYDSDIDTFYEILSNIQKNKPNLTTAQAVNYMRFRAIFDYYGNFDTLWNNDDLSEYIERTNFVKNLIENINEDNINWENISYLIFGPVGKRYTAPFAWVSSGFNSQQVHIIYTS